MRRTSFASPPSRGPRGLALVGGLSVIFGLCWWLWPEDDPGLSARAVPDAQEKPEPKPAKSKPKPAKSPREQQRATNKREPAQGPSKPKPAADDPMALTRKKLAALRRGGDADALRRSLSKLALHPRTRAKERDAWLKEADTLNDRLIWSATPGPGFTVAKVEPGDSYWKIARRVSRGGDISVTAGMLEAINKVRPARLRLGQSLKVPTEAVSLLVDKSAFELYVLIGGVYAGRFAIGIGRDSSTPEGSFTLRGKTAKPQWTDPKTGKRYNYGQEGHLIGSRWLGLHKDGGTTGYGVHGTVDPETIGQAASDGCIRLTNADVELLYELVPEGASVAVRR